MCEFSIFLLFLRKGWLTQGWELTHETTSDPSVAYVDEQLQIVVQICAGNSSQRLVSPLVIDQGATPPNLLPPPTAARSSPSSVALGASGVMRYALSVIPSRFDNIE